MTISIEGLNKAEVLAALYNAIPPPAEGVKSADHDVRPMTVERAQKILDSDIRQDFNYLHGRAIKVKLSGNEIITNQYNRHNGKGLAERVIQSLRPMPFTQMAHQEAEFQKASIIRHIRRRNR